MTDRHIFVEGRPAPQGSKSYKGLRNGKPVLVESSKGVGPWRDKIAWEARRRGGMLHRAPVAATIDFVLPRPVQTPKRMPTPPAVKRPDLDKLIRAVTASARSMGCFCAAKMARDLVKSDVAARWWNTERPLTHSLEQARRG